jgi:hypothetical protein
MVFVYLTYEKILIGMIYSFMYCNRNSYNPVDRRKHFIILIRGHRDSEFFLLLVVFALDD